MSEQIRNCPDCNAEPGAMHETDCDVEQCSNCGCQRLQCACDNHDQAFARWSGWWPGSLEAQALGIDLNQLYIQGYNKTFFIKPGHGDFKYSISDWKDEVASDHTRLSYRQWVYVKAIAIE